MFKPEKGKPSPLIALVIDGKQKCQISIASVGGKEHVAVKIMEKIMKAYANGSTAIDGLYVLRNGFLDQYKEGELEHELDCELKGEAGSGLGNESEGMLEDGDEGNDSDEGSDEAGEYLEEPEESPGEKDDASVSGGHTESST